MEWYLLFEGSSTDGRGQPRYVGRTRCKKEAQAHFIAVRKSPHSTGKVMIANDVHFRDVTEQDFK